MSYSRENLIIRSKGANMHYVLDGDYLTVYTDLMINGFIGGPNSLFEKVPPTQEVYKRFSLPNGDEIEGFLYTRIKGLSCDIPYIGSHKIVAVEKVEVIEMYELNGKMYTRPEMASYIKSNFTVPEGKVINLNLKNRSSVFISDDSFGGVSHE